MVGKAVVGADSSLPPPPRGLAGIRPQRLVVRPLLMCAWLVALVLWMVVLTGAALAVGPKGQIRPPVGIVVVGLLLLALFATVGFGGWLASQRRWPPFVLAAGLGTLALLAGYLGASVAVASSNPGGDAMAGVGVVLLAVPTLVLVVVLLGVGAAPVLVWQRYHRQAATASAR